MPSTPDDRLGGSCDSGFEEAGVENWEFDLFISSMTDDGTSLTGTRFSTTGSALYDDGDFSDRYGSGWYDEYH